MTISEQIHKITHFNKGNFEVFEDAIIEGVSISKGANIALVCLLLGGAWIGNNCFFEDGSRLIFENCIEIRVFGQ